VAIRPKLGPFISRLSDLVEESLPWNLFGIAGKPNAPRIGRAAEADVHRDLSLVMKPLELRFVTLIFGPKLAGLDVLTDLGRCDVPPAATAGKHSVFFNFGDDHTRASFEARLAQRALELIDCLGMPHAGAEARRVCGQVDSHVVSIQPIGSRVAVAKLI